MTLGVGVERARVRGRYCGHWKEATARRLSKDFNLST